MPGHLQWSEPERKHFAQHILPLRTPEGFPDLTPAAAVMQAAMARIYSTRRREYNHDMLYQYWYRKHNQRAAERGEEDRQVFGAPAGYPGPPRQRATARQPARARKPTHAGHLATVTAKPRPPKRIYNVFAEDADSEASGDQGGLSAPKATGMNVLEDDVLNIATGSPLPSQLRRGKIFAPKRRGKQLQTAEPRSSPEIHPPRASVAPFPAEGFDIACESYDDIYEEEERDYALSLADQNQDIALDLSEDVSVRGKVASGGRAQQIAPGNGGGSSASRAALFKKMIEQDSRASFPPTSGARSRFRRPLWRNRFCSSTSICC